MITVFYDPAGICKTRRFDSKAPFCLLEFLKEHYPDGFEIPTTIYRGWLAEDCAVDLNEALANDLIISPKDDYYIVHTPQGLDPFTVGIFVLAFAVAASISVPTQALVTPPAIPETRQPKESPNNSLSGQTNIARPLQRIPDIYGKNKVWPDLITKPYFEFINHVKFQFEYMCIGTGEYLVEEEKTGDTLLDNIEGTLSTIFGPDTAQSDLLDVRTSNEVAGQDLKGQNLEKVSLDSILVEFISSTVFKTFDSRVKDFELLDVGDRVEVFDPVGSRGIVQQLFTFATNKITSTTQVFSGFRVDDMMLISDSDNNDGRVIITNVQVSELTVKNTDGTTTVFTSDADDTCTLQGRIENDDDMTFFSITEAPVGPGVIEYTVTQTGTPWVAADPHFVKFTTLAFSLGTEQATSEARFKLIDTSTVLTVGMIGDTVLNGNGANAIITGFDNVDSVTLSSDIMRTGDSYKTGLSIFRIEETGPIQVPGNPDQIWIDIQFPRGLQSTIPITVGLESSGRQLTIEIEQTLQEVDSAGDPIGSAEVSILSFSDDSVDPRFYTVKTVPAVPGGLYEITLKRLTDSNPSTGVRELCKWTRLAGVEDFTVTDYGDVTTWFVETQATDQAVSVQERKFNAIVTRKLPTYDRSEDEMDGVNAATARIADAVVYILTNEAGGNKPEAQLDLEGLYDIQDALDADAIYGDKLGRFCYTFSSDKTPVNDEVNTALRAARMFKFQEGNIIKFGRDQLNNFRSMSFNRRIKKPDSEKKTLIQYLPNDQNGITLNWVDEETGDSDTLTFPEGEEPTNPKRIEAAGIKNYEQAWNIGFTEMQKLIFNRISVETTVLRDGLLVSPNARVANVDSTTVSAQDGEIIGEVGLLLETSNPVDFAGELTSVAIFRHGDGTSSQALVEPRGDSVDGFQLLAPLSEDIVLRGTDDNNQMGTLYTFTGSDDLSSTSQDYLIQEIAPAEDGYVDIRMINYTEAVYDADETVPTTQT